MVVTALHRNPHLVLSDSRQGDHDFPSIDVETGSEVRLAQ